MKVKDPALLAKPRLSGAVGEASTVYFERAFERNAVKLLPGEYFVSEDDIVLSTVLGSCVAGSTRSGTESVSAHFCTQVTRLQSG